MCTTLSLSKWYSIVFTFGLCICSLCGIMCQEGIRMQSIEIGTIPIFFCLVLLTQNNMAPGANHASSMELFFLHRNELVWTMGGCVHVLEFGDEPTQHSTTPRWSWWGISHLELGQCSGIRVIGPPQSF